MPFDFWRWLGMQAKASGGGRTRMTASGLRPVSKDGVDAVRPNRSAQRRAKDRARAKAGRKTRQRNYAIQRRK